MENQPVEQPISAKPVKKRRISRRFLLGAVVAALLVGAMSYMWLVITTPKPATEISQLVDRSEATQGDFTLSEVTIANTGAKITASAQLTYVGTEPTKARLTFTLLFTGNNQLQGRKYLEITDIQPNEQRPLEVSIIGDFGRSDSYKLEIEKT
jgi:hypothetical protein